MPHLIKHPKDFWTGVIFLVFGLSAVLIGRDYAMGTAGKMGPAYFPTVLGGLLSVVGGIAVFRSFKRVGEQIERFHLKELFIVLAAVVLFGLLMRGAGLAPAAVVLIMISAYASPQFKWHEALLLALGMAGFAVLVFVKLLGLPLQVFGPWLQF
ncbi:MAG: tripartite tricarboxylate transporter TctB family protein [Burkholderiaceae bacterium]|nr:tripartite tricarboxylate transporter TctB family protein [Burkholderiaceae bacterium]